MILMLQKEVALKFDYNLANMNKYKFMTKTVSNFERCFDVSRKVFIPKPKITSTVVKFKFINKKVDFDKANNFSKLIFKNIRKKIHNNLKIKLENNLLNKRISQLSIEDLFEIYDLF